MLAVLGLLAASLLLSGRAPLAINVSESLPVGLYWMHPLPRLEQGSGRPSDARTVVGTGLNVGMLVSACLPPEVAARARQRGYLPDGSCPTGGAPVGKAVAALAGDTVAVTDLGSFVNGAPLPKSAPLARDSQGRPMPRVRGRVVLPAGTAWLHSGHSPRSFDSRYYGPVPLSGVQGELVPLLTW